MKPNRLAALVLTLLSPLAAATARGQANPVYTALRLSGFQRSSE